MDLGFEHLDPALRWLCAREFARIVRRWCLVFCDEEGSHGWRSSLTEYGLDHVRGAAWIRQGGAPQFTGDRPASGHEVIEVSHPKGRKSWNGGGKRGVYEHPIVINRGGKGYERQHTTEKPESLMMELVSDFTDPGDLILDPFAGSGTTGVAAIRLRRRCLLIERDPKYAAIAVERLMAEESDSTLRDIRQGQLPLIAGGGTIE